MSRLSTRDSVSESVQEKVKPQSPRKGEISQFCNGRDWNQTPRY